MQQLAPSSVRSDTSVHSGPETSRSSTGGRAHHHDWVPRRASGRESFQTDDGPGVKAAKRVAESSKMESPEVVPLSRRDSSSLEGTEELWAAMGPTTAFWLDPPENLDYSVDALWNSVPVRSGGGLLSDENEIDVAERKQWQEWAKHAAEHERQRRMKVSVVCWGLDYLGVMNSTEETEMSKLGIPYGQFAE